MPSLVTNVTNFVNRAATEFRTIRALITGTSTGTLAGLTTADKTSIVAAINELDAAVDAAAASGGATNLDQLTDVTITAPADGNILRRQGGVFVNVDGATIFQPLDPDLTAIAALATTTYGRAFLALADQAGLMALVPSASETVQGKVELATTAETQTGTDTVRATHAAGVKAAIDQRILNDNTLGGGAPSGTNAASQAAAKAYIDSLLAAANAMVFKGVIDASTNPNYPAANAGDVYRISVDGRIGGAAGPVVEVGDQILALADGLATGSHATVGASWNITQVNIDGAVTGPANAVSGNIVVFNGTSGKVVQDSGFTPSNAAIGAGSATILPTSAQVVAFAQPKDADLTAIAALASAADTAPFATGAGAWALYALTAFGRTLAGSADAAAARASLSVYSQADIGNPDTDFVAAFNAALTA